MMNLKSREGTLDLHRRRVAAISFLSNISTGVEEPSINLDCLVGTKVLKDFAANKRKWDLGKKETRKSKLRQEGKEEIKKSCLKLHTEGCSEAKEESYSAPAIDARVRPYSESGAVNPSSAPLSSSSSRRPSQGFGFYFAGDDVLDNGHNISVSRTLSRKKVGSISKSEAGSVITGSSSESLILPNAAFNSRFRKISGNISEGSAATQKEVKIFRPREDSPEIRGFANDRMVLVELERKIPITIFSTIGFHRSPALRGNPHSRNDHNSRKHRSSANVPRPLSSINDLKDTTELIPHEKSEETQETSYSYLLHPSTAVKWSASIDELHELSSSSISCKNIFRYPTNDMRNSSPTGFANLTTEVEAYGSVYHPQVLDGWLIAGKHRTYLPFQSYITSVIEYVKPSEMKKELNEKFKEKFPQLQLTLSKLRSLKREMLKIAHGECKIDSLTIALSYVYFEMLVMKNAITKPNRKLCAGACLLLAAKLNDVKGSPLKNLLEKIEGGFRVSRKELISSEFSVLVALEFGLHVPTWQIFPHYQRLLYEL